MKFLWTGTDSLMMVDYSMRRPIKRIYWWFFRRFVRIAENFIQAHACISPNIGENLMRFGVKKPIEHIDTMLRYTEKFNKIEHETFNILYYFPIGGDIEFNKWLYGWDVAEAVQNALIDRNVRFMIVNGDNDMKYVYPYVDFYLRPNRHDGPSRIRMECDINEIPYYWTQKDPSVEDAIKAIEKCLK